LQVDVSNCVVAYVHVVLVVDKAAVKSVHALIESLRLMLGTHWEVLRNALGHQVPVLLCASHEEVSNPAIVIVVRT